MLVSVVVFFLVLVFSSLSCFVGCKLVDKFCVRTWMVLSKYEERDLDNKLTYKVEIVNNSHTSSKKLVINKAMYDEIKFTDTITFKDNHVLAWAKR